MKIEIKRLTGSLPFVAERSIPCRDLLSSEDLRSVKNSLFRDHGSLPAQQNSFHFTWRILVLESDLTLKTTVVFDSTETGEISQIPEVKKTNVK